MLMNSLTRRLPTISIYEVKGLLQKSTYQFYSSQAESKLSTNESQDSQESTTFEEVKIPTLNGVLAGKLWRPKKSSNTNAVEGTPVICTHGFLDNAGTFDTLIPLLLEDGQINRKFLSLDLPGHGFSSHWPATLYDQHMNGFVGILKSMRHFNWPRVTLMGHSLGAQVSYLFASAFSEKTDRFIALDNFHPVPAPNSDVPQWLRSLGLNQEALELKSIRGKSPPSYTYNEILDKLYFGREETITREGCQILLRRGAIEQPDGKFAFTYDICSAMSPVPGKFTVEEAKLIGAGITAPICLIKANPGADYQPREQFMDVVRFMQGINKNVEFHSIAGTHSVHLNEPHKVAPIISKFLI